MFFEKIFHSITGKLILTIGALMIAGSVVFWYLLIRYQENILLNNTVAYGNSIVDNIKNSTRYGMLKFQQKLIQETIEAISSSEAIINLRIFDNRGKIAYASDKRDIGTVFDINSSLCSSCHGTGGPAQDTRGWTITKGTEYRVINIVTPIYNEPSCYTADCHVHSREQKVLGLVEADLSLAPLDKSIQHQGIAISFYIILFIIVISLILGAIFWQFVTTPLKNLARGMKTVADGDLDHHVIIHTKDELEDLANAFNSMTTDLKKAKKELIDWGNTLEKKVEEKKEQIKNAQAQLIHSEKLASLGRMAAGVAHELNSPLTGIVTFGHLLQKQFPPDSEERKDLDVIIDQANRCSGIIKGLLGFARASIAEKSALNIHDVLNSSLNIVRNKADFFNIKLVTEYDESLPRVKADSSQLQQVFLNMIMNAADAIEDRGTITITTKAVSEDGIDFIELEFRDTGQGISDENLGKLFEPFFTTKPVGKGTGLGLAVSHGLVQEHGGKIYVRTKVGKGTSFFIRLPAYSEST